MLVGGVSAICLQNLGGPCYTFHIAITVVLVDTFAFFGGYFLGKRKLWEEVSPNKTWEGAIIGYMAGFFYAIFYPLVDNFLLKTLTALLIPLLAQIGDMFESKTKRILRIKDSSKFLGAHGGFLDRLDSLIFTFPVYFFLFKVILGGG